MNVIVTADGKEIDVDHGFGEISEYAIAWSLAQLNRFNGHALRPYSVAEHSLLVLEIMERQLLVTDVHAHLAGLMHDAHEAVTGDMHSPGKSAIGAAWSQWEEQFESKVRSQFALHTASTAFRDVIHQADLIALATERRDLMPWHAELSPWPVLYGVLPADWIDLRDASRRNVGWEDWRDRFLDKFHELEFARNELMGANQ